MITETKTATVCVVGAGYVGLPLSNTLAKNYRVISFDNNPEKVRILSGRNGNHNHVFTADPGKIAEADFIAVCVPTPLSDGKRPDMTYIKEAAEVIGRHMKKGATVIIESSVYPGATEELIRPVLEQASGYTCGKDFKLAYSPERINPGDTEHDIDKVTKIVAACDKETLERVTEFYHHVTPHVFKARNIRTAEAAKLVENTQRDLNIAFVNELAMMFSCMGLDTKDVLDAAGTKWNFQRLSPGLVGGYCIPVVPYFLVQKAEEYGYHPQMILAGRAVNDAVPKHIAEMTVKSINATGKVIKGARVLIIGCTYKDNVTDTRATQIRTVIKELREYDIDVYGYDPLVENAEKEFGIKFLGSLGGVIKMDAVIFNVVHDVFKNITLETLRKNLNPSSVIVDIRGFLNEQDVRNSGITYKRL
jgi:UDPglucose 6-dehydrogenase/UDP-N-acetyl-D-galactosamine dehydrogenase